MAQSTSQSNYTFLKVIIRYVVQALTDLLYHFMIYLVCLYDLADVNVPT